MIKIFLKKHFLLKGLINSVYPLMKGYFRPIWNGCDQWIEDQLVEILKQIPESIRQNIRMTKARMSCFGDGDFPVTRGSRRNHMTIDRTLKTIQAPEEKVGVWPSLYS